MFKFPWVVIFYFWSSSFVGHLIMSSVLGCLSNKDTLCFVSFSVLCAKLEIPASEQAMLAHICVGCCGCFLMIHNGFPQQCQILETYKRHISNSLVIYFMKRHLCCIFNLVWGYDLCGHFEWSEFGLQTFQVKFQIGWGEHINVWNCNRPPVSPVQTRQKVHFLPVVFHFNTTFPFNDIQTASRWWDFPTQFWILNGNWNQYIPLDEYHFIIKILTVDVCKL